MDSPIRILLVEDVSEDAELLIRELRRGKLDVVTHRVDSEPALREALTGFQPHVILSDYNLPDFGGSRALEVAQAHSPDVPFIFVSGTIGEERAIEALHHGAVDYVLKDSRARLVPAVQRALRDATERESRRRAERQLAASEERFSSIADATQEWIWEVDLAGIHTFCNPAVSKILGFAPEELVGTTSFDYVDESDRKSAIEVVTTAIAQRTGWRDLVQRWRHKDGSIRFLESTALPLFAANGEVKGYRGTDRDITLRIQQQEKIARLSRIYAVSSGINGMIVRVRERNQLFRDACRIAVEQGGFKMVWIGAIDPESGDGEPIAWAGSGTANIDRIRLTSRAGLPHSDRPACRAARENRPIVCNDLLNEATLTALASESASGGYRSLAALPLVSDGRVDAVIVLLAGERDFFDSQEMQLLEELAADISFALDYLVKQERLNYMSLHDPLTGLANREMFFDRLKQVMGTLRDDRRPLAVIVIDLQRFRLINDTLGRGAGDEILKAFASRLEGVFGHAPTLARIGADRFSVAVDGMSSSMLAHLIQYRIIDGLAFPFSHEGRELRVACKIGVAMYPEDAREPESLFRNAEAALHRAKDTADTYTFYSPEMNAQVFKRLQLEGRLRNAVSERQFTLAYQPKVELGRRRIVGLEALIRWNDAVLGPVSPLEFIPVLEETGMIVEAGRQVLEQAVTDMLRWKAEGCVVPRVAVNVSYVQVRHKDFVATVRAAVGSNADLGLDLEITESLVLEDLHSGMAKLGELRADGMRIYMDDFGTGYSNLGQIAAMPLDALKIDRIFIARMAKSAEATAIVSTIISLARALRIDVVAEGVETEEQATLLAALGCGQAQGYLFGHPTQPAEIGKLLART